MKKSILAFILILFFPLLGLAQERSKTNDAKNSSKEQVLICEDEDKLSFHSHAQCIGLETCDTQLKYIDAIQATKKYARYACCICWDNPGEDCKNDNPDYYSDEADYEDDSGVYVDDLWWLNSTEPYFIVIALATSVALVSNEVYVGATYPFLPPKLTTTLSQSIEKTVGGSLIFRKNFKPDALEYGISAHSYSVEDRQSNRTRFYDIQNYVISIAYLHELNQHFSTQKDPLVDIKFYAGPMISYGWNFLDEAVNDQFGIGGTFGIAIPLGKKINLDFRSTISSYSSDFSIGFRWLYQRKLPWNR